MANNDSAAGGTIRSSNQELSPEPRDLSPPEDNGLTIRDGVPAAAPTAGVQFIPMGGPEAVLVGIAGKAWQPGDLVDRRYRLVEPLGAGSFGQVWKAIDLMASTERMTVYVALKFFPALVVGDRDNLEEVKEEYQRMHNLNHPNIAAHKGLVDGGGADALVMEFVEGTTLSRFRWMKAGSSGGLPLAEALALAGQVAEGLDYAHRKGIVHRDIKPTNVMVTLSGEVKIIDFGLAAEIRSHVSRRTKAESGVVAGTRLYMAPEQWRGKRPCKESDQYGLGALIYELLSGDPPFVGDDENILRMCVLNETPDPLETLDASRNATLLKALSKDPKDRFPNCVAFVRTLSGETTRKKERTEAEARRKEEAKCKAEEVRRKEEEKRKTELAKLEAKRKETERLAAEAKARTAEVDQREEARRKAAEARHKEEAKRKEAERLAEEAKHKDGQKRLSEMFELNAKRKEAERVNKTRGSWSETYDAKKISAQVAAEAAARAEAEAIVDAKRREAEAEQFVLPLPIAISFFALILFLVLDSFIHFLFMPKILGGSIGARIAHFGYVVLLLWGQGASWAGLMMTVDSRFEKHEREMRRRRIGFEKRLMGERCIGGLSMLIATVFGSYALIKSFYLLLKAIFGWD